MGRYLPAAALAACIVLAWPCMAQTRAQDAATQRQTQRTDQANRDATVADEAGTAQPARAAQSDAAAGRPALSYGPVLNPRGQQNGDAVRKDPAEVRDETDTLARQTPPQQARQPEKQLTDKRREELRRRAARRHQAWQGEGPMAPRPLRAGETPPATAAVPIPPPLPAPQPTVPSSSVIRACQGIVCTDAAGNTFNGSGNAGVGSGGRACARTGTTVQCF
ncbi:hypothetical protein [Massilia putida]|uniref:hypothetical protein n=1 Tax=Massilia putida TaxID=1141883 RepID=UPI000952D232|nr:hypothetical protein [Massilia putida]